jgi:hypothetical protein
MKYFFQKQNQFSQETVLDPSASDTNEFLSRDTCVSLKRTREKVRSKRINLEGNTHAQEINVSQLPV